MFFMSCFSLLPQGEWSGFSKWFSTRSHSGPQVLQTSAFSAHQRMLYRQTIASGEAVKESGQRESVVFLALEYFCEGECVCAWLPSEVLRQHSFTVCWEVMQLVSRHADAKSCSLKILQHYSNSIRKETSYGKNIPGPLVHIRASWQRWMDNPDSLRALQACCIHTVVPTRLPALLMKPRKEQMEGKGEMLLLWLILCSRKIWHQIHKHN